LTGGFSACSKKDFQAAICVPVRNDLLEPEQCV